MFFADSRGCDPEGLALILNGVSVVVPENSDVWTYDVDYIEAVSEGRGDCDWKAQCSGELVCGYRNCIGDSFDEEDDCCTTKSESIPHDRRHRSSECCPFLQ